ncbi:unnamed protein product [Amoebophrya sp. A25]|nr:unnamed protein product [Amoebophrya sp. A25]|eukprot:GSA25T00014386001.1
MRHFDDLAFACWTSWTRPGGGQSFSSRGTTDTNVLFSPSSVASSSSGRMSRKEVFKKTTRHLRAREYLTATSFAVETVVPPYDQTGRWNENYRPMEKDFAMNVPWNQTSKGGPFVGPFLADASHPFGGPVNTSRLQVLWNSVQPRDPYGSAGVDTTNYLLEGARHYYAGPEPRTQELYWAPPPDIDMAGGNIYMPPGGLDEGIPPKIADRNTLYTQTLRRAPQANDM